MSFAAESWAWKQTCQSSAAKLVLVCLSWHASKEGDQAWPSIATICRLTELAERTVRKVLKELSAPPFDLIEKVARNTSTGRCLTSEYRLNMREQTLANQTPLADLPEVDLPLEASKSASQTTHLPEEEVPVQDSTESVPPRAREDFVPIKPRGNSRDPANGWMQRYDDSRVEIDEGRPCVNGYYLDATVEAATDEAGRWDRPFAVMDQTIIALLAEGYTCEQITAGVRKKVAAGHPGKTMAYYAMAIRDQRPDDPAMAMRGGRR